MRLVSVSGALLAAAAIAGATSAHADEPAPNQAQQAAATSPIEAGAPSQPVAALPEVAQPAADQQLVDQQQQHAADQQQQQSDQGAAAAAPAMGATQASSMATSIGTSVGMMAPSLAMYAPMMFTPLLSQGIPALAGLAAQNPELLGLGGATGGGAVAGTEAASAAALPDLSSVLDAGTSHGLSSVLDAGTAADLTSVLDAGTTADLTSVLDAGTTAADLTSVLDPGTEIAGAAADIGPMLAGETGGNVACTVLAAIGLC